MISEAERAELRKELEQAQKRVIELERRLGHPISPLDSQDLIKVTLEQTLEGLQIIGRDWCYLYINIAAANQGKRSREQLLGRSMMDCFPGIESTDFGIGLQSVLDGGPARQMENLFEYPDGTRCWFELFIEPHSLGALVRSIDITDRKKIEEQYRHSQKMESIGLLAGGMAHDFNNKLGIMMIYSDLIDSEVGPEQENIKRYLANVVMALKDATSLTKQLLAFSRKQVLDLRVTNLNDVIDRISDSLRKLIGENIQLVTTRDEDIANVRVDPSQMDQVILNLAVNARDAMPDGGTLTIETASVELDREYCDAHVGVNPGSYIMMSIRDTGHGMAPEVRERIFEPFFTTKPKGRGTGLGLSSVHGIVAQSRGHITVQSEIGAGTTFRLYFPVVQERKQKRNVSSSEVVDTRGTERILLVEDDSLLRDALAVALSTAGYGVFTASAAREAKEIFMNEKGKIDLVLTDVIMPHHSGHELATELQALKSELKVAYISGYTENIMAQHGILNAHSVLIQKPIATKKLLATVRQILDGKLTKGIV